MAQLWIVRQQSVVMRFSLIDLLIETACIASGFAASNGVGRWTGYHFFEMNIVFGILMSAIVFIIVTPPIYRWLRLLPLFIPPCPHCKRRPGAYRITEARWPRHVIICSRCEKPTELWWRKPAVTDVSKTMPSVVLSWPESIGRWRLVSEGEVSAA